jgi:hypothetical protein
VEISKWASIFSWVPSISHPTPPRALALPCLAPARRRRPTPLPMRPPPATLPSSRSAPRPACAPCAGASAPAPRHSGSLLRPCTGRPHTPAIDIEPRSHGESSEHSSCTKLPGRGGEGGDGDSDGEEGNVDTGGSLGVGGRGLGSVSARAPLGGTTQEQREFDYLNLSLQWPGTICTSPATAAPATGAAGTCAPPRFPPTASSRAPCSISISHPLLQPSGASP